MRQGGVGGTCGRRRGGGARVIDVPEGGDERGGAGGDGKLWVGEFGDPRRGDPGIGAGRVGVGAG